MNYSNKFKQKVVDIFKYSRDLPHIIKAMEREDHDTVRVILENSIDDISLYDVKRVDKNGKLKIHRLKKDTYNERKSLYDEFMVGYDDHLNHKVKQTGNRLIHDGGRIQK